MPSLLLVSGIVSLAGSMRANGNANSLPFRMTTTPVIPDSP